MNAVSLHFIHTFYFIKFCGLKLFLKELVFAHEGENSTRKIIEYYLLFWLDGYKQLKHLLCWLLSFTSIRIVSYWINPRGVISNLIYYRPISLIHLINFITVERGWSEYSRDRQIFRIWWPNTLRDKISIIHSDKQCTCKLIDDTVLLAGSSYFVPFIIYCFIKKS